jgi:hypothetical protein
MPPALTVITPIAPRHAALFAECAASVAQQTADVEHLYMIDQAGHGPAAIRNWLLRQVKTPYVTFLDADDWLEPTFAEETLQAVRPARYIYTDWYQEGAQIEAPECAWTRGTHHLVTAVLPTAWARAVDGFDEALRGMEDTDFYVKLVTRGFCGRRLPNPLVHYRRGGGRAARIHETGEVHALNAEMARRYGGMNVACCGDTAVIEDVPAGVRGENDVLARALWGGNRVQMGLASGRHYPRTGNGKLVWVDQRDILAAPHHWQAVPEPPDQPLVEQDSPKAGAPELTTKPRGLAALEAQMVAIGAVRVPRSNTASQSVGAGGIVSPTNIAQVPNIRKVVRLARKAYGDVDTAVFVMPRKVYPSYFDLWRLVELAGFEAVYQDEVDLRDARQTYIFAAPDGIPDCTNASAHTIFWALEYAGNYVSVKNAQTVREIWSSDPAHAQRSGVRYVPLGSHRGLKPDLDTKRGDLYDITMLAYMVHRREVIKNRLSAYRWPENYPGHDGARRHEVLSNTRLMVHVHQHEEAALTPLRLALAAAYRMTAISETVPNPGMYRDAVIWADYQDIAGRVELNLQGKDGTGDSSNYGDKLYQLLCVEHPFDKCVIEAVEASRSALGSAGSAKAIAA